MPQICSLKQYRVNHRLRMVTRQVRIPADAVAEAQQLANEASMSGYRITESDLYRTAILDFLSVARQEKEKNE